MRERAGREGESGEERERGKGPTKCRALTGSKVFDPERNYWKT